MVRGRRPLVGTVASIVAVSLALTVPDVAGADQQTGLSLTSTSDAASWSGEFAAGAFGRTPSQVFQVLPPEACTGGLCDVVYLDVQLPDRTWQSRPGGMLVAIRTPDAFDAKLDLFVYGPDGTEVASSTGFVSNQAAWVPDPVDGRYTVKVVPGLVAGQLIHDGVLEPVVYDGFVKFQRGLTIQRKERNFSLEYTRRIVAFGFTENQPAVELLPDLVPTTPRHFQLAFGRPDVGQPSCLPTETLGLHDDEPRPEPGLRRCLRFDQGAYNFGDGPFQLNVYEVEDDVFEVYQRIYSSDGSVRQIGPLGEVEFSDAHGHFHYLGFQEITLHRVEEDGSLTFVREKPDKGICMVDIEMGWFGRTDRSTSPPGYPALSGPSCITFSHQDDHDPTHPDKWYFEMGMSVGWADIYPNIQAEQYLDITGLDDGEYGIVVRQDVGNRILEKTTRNNTAMGCVRIEGDVAEDIPCETTNTNVQGVDR